VKFNGGENMGIAAPAKTNLGGGKDFQDIKPKSKKRLIIKLLIFLLVIGLIVGAGVAVFVFNVFDIREQHVRPLIEDVPIVSNLLPEVEITYLEPQITVEDLQVDIAALNQQLAALEAERDNLRNLNAMQTEHIARLTEVEANQLRFTAEIAEFNRQIAEGSPVNFVNWFESIREENLELLYNEISADLDVRQRIDGYVASFETMSARNASTILEQMMTTELELVLAIMAELSLTQRSSVLTAMETNNAATIQIRLAPQELS